MVKFIAVVQLYTVRGVRHAAGKKIGSTTRGREAHLSQITIIIYMEKRPVEEVVLVIVVDSLHLVGNKFYATRRGGI